MGATGTILVTGATGHVGRHVVAGLRARGVPVRALSRGADRAETDGVQVVRGDLTNRRDVDVALEGVGAVFLVWPLFSAEAAPPVVEALAGPGRRIVYVSAMSVRDEADPQTNGVWGRIEHLITAAGAESTFLRCGGFATNTLLWADQIRTGVVRWPYGRAARSLIHERDIADVAVRALTQDGHAGRSYVLTGPQAVTQQEQVQLIGEAIGRPVSWQELTPGLARRELLAQWSDPEFVDHALAYWASLVASPEPVTGVVEEITGSPARTFRRWALDHAADFGADRRGSDTGPWQPIDR